MLKWSFHFGCVGLLKAPQKFSRYRSRLTTISSHDGLRRCRLWFLVFDEIPMFKYFGFFKFGDRLVILHVHESSSIPAIFNLHTNMSKPPRGAGQSSVPRHTGMRRRGLTFGPSNLNRFKNSRRRSLSSKRFAGERTDVHEVKL